jgi:hypothetical protein
MAKKPAKLKKMKTMAKKSAKPAKKAPAKSGKVAAGPSSKARVSSKPRNTSTLSYTQSEFVENVRAFCGLHKRSEA